MTPRAVSRSATALSAALLLVFLVIASPSAAGAAGRPGDREEGGRPEQRVAYFVQWGIYARQYFVKDVATSGQAAGLTTLNYAFGNVNSAGQCASADTWADFQRPSSATESVDGVADAPTALAGNFNQLRKLKQLYPNLRVVMSLGGFTLSTFFSDAALTAQSRQSLVQSCIDLFLKGNLPGLAPGAGAGVFDGFDIDWEWPATAANAGTHARPEDRHNFTLLLAEFRRQLNQLGEQTDRHYSLTAFLPADPVKIRAGFEVEPVLHLLDWGSVQGYDLHGTWETTTNHQSSLFVPAGDPSPASARFSIDGAIQTYLSLGAPARKLVLGVPFYSRGWTGVPGANHGLFQPSTGPAPGVFEAGVNDYKAVAALPGFTTYRDPANGVAWLYDGNTFWTFDDPTALAQKMHYVRDRGLGGAAAWSLDGDAGGSLVKAIDEGLAGRERG